MGATVHDQGGFGQPQVICQDQGIQPDLIKLLTLLLLFSDYEHQAPTEMAWVSILTVWISTILLNLSFQSEYENLTLSILPPSEGYILMYTPSGVYGLIANETSERIIIIRILKSIYRISLLLNQDILKNHAFNNTSILSNIQLQYIVVNCYVLHCYISGG